MTKFARHHPAVPAPAHSIAEAARRQRRKFLRQAAAGLAGAAAAAPAIAQS